MANAISKARKARNAARKAPLPETRYKIEWFGRQLAIVVSRTPEGAIEKLINMRGYTYYTPDCLVATNIG